MLSLLARPIACSSDRASSDTSGGTSTCSSGGARPDRLLACPAPVRACACACLYAHVWYYIYYRCFTWNIYIVPYNCLYNCIWFWVKIFFVWNFSGFSIIVFSIIVLCYLCRFFAFLLLKSLCFYAIFGLFLCVICYNCILYLSYLYLYLYLYLYNCVYMLIHILSTFYPQL